MRIEALSNGLGGQSMYCGWLASQGRIPATISISADTGSEEDCDWNTGEKTSARYYFEQVAKPLFEKWGMDAYFVRAVDKNKVPLPPIHEWQLREIERAKRGERKAKYGAIMIPMFGSQKGRLTQSCTERWKIAAIKQQARRLGATHLCSAQGIHYGEAARRVKGVYDGERDGFSHYKTAKTNRTTKEVTVIQWMSHYYPLVDLKLNRWQVRGELERLGIPYLLSTECDHCPHKDAGRWLRSSPATIEAAAALEDKYQGEYFLNSRRRSLREVIDDWKFAAAMNPALLTADEASFGCDGGICGV